MNTQVDMTVRWTSGWQARKRDDGVSGICGSEKAGEKRGRGQIPFGRPESEKGSLVSLDNEKWKVTSAVRDVCLK